ncbi:hypothetical protein Tco_1207602, partial [Tanacetum coccineum]
VQQLCLLCECLQKQIPAFYFFCASLEAISAIEMLLERGEVWEQNRVLAGIGGKIGKGFIQVGL